MTAVFYSASFWRSGALSLHYHIGNEYKTLERSYYN